MATKQFTMPPDTRVVGSPFPPGDMDGLVDAVTQGLGAAANLLNTAYGTIDPTGVLDSTAGINLGLSTNAGSDCFLPAGTYKVSAPIVVPPYTGFRGVPMGTSVLANASNAVTGTVLVPTANFTSGVYPALATGVILIPDIVTGGFAQLSQEQHVQDIVINGATNLGNLTTWVNGVCLYSAAGQQIGQISLRNIFCNNMSGWGLAMPLGSGQVRAFNVVSRSASSQSPPASWAATTNYVYGNIIQTTTFPGNNFIYMCTTAGQSGGSPPAFPTTTGNTVGDGSGALVWTCLGSYPGGLQIHNSDSNYVYCASLRSFWDGFQVLDSGNSKFTHCHSEHYDSAGGVALRYTSNINNQSVSTSGGLTFVNFTTDAGSNDGIYLTSGTNFAPPVTFTGGYTRNSGFGGTFAGVHIHGYQGPVNFAGFSVYPGNTGTPAYALKLDGNNSSTFVSITGGVWNGGTAFLNCDGSQGSLVLGPDVITASGEGSSTVYSCAGVPLAALSAASLTQQSRTVTYLASSAGNAIPAGATLLKVTVVGGGGGGGGSAGSSPTQIGASGGGGGAGQAVEQYVAVSAANTYSVTVGATANGGTAGTINQGAAGQDGSGGNDSVFNYNSSAVVVTAKGGGPGKGGALGTNNGGNGGQYGGVLFLSSSLTQSIPGQGSPGGGSNATAFGAGLGFGFGGTGGGGGGGANGGTANGTGGSAGGQAGTFGGQGGTGGGGGTQTGGNAAANSGAGGGGAGGTKTVASTGAAGVAGGNGGSGYVIVEAVG